MEEKKETIKIVLTCWAPVSDICLHLKMLAKKRGPRDDASCTKISK
jgi:hypothetical protein